MVTALRFQVHANPIKDFILQGSNDTTTGFDGVWSDIFAGTVTNRTELAWQDFLFPSNTNPYFSYRVTILNDYLASATFSGAFAMYRWDLEGQSVPEPGSFLLLATGLAGAGARRWRKLLKH